MKSIYNLVDGDGITLSSPIRFTNSVNLNYYYGPYGWKDDQGTIHRYFEYKRGSTITRYPNYATDSTHIHPYGMTPEECFEDDGAGNEVYMSSYVYGYALACVFLKKIGAAAGTTFGVIKVIDNEEVVVEFIYDGLDSNNRPFAHIKVDTEEITNTVQNAIQDKIPTFTDKEGREITDLGNYFEQQLSGFVQDSTLNSYALKDDLFVDGKFILDKMPDAVARTSALNSYALSSDLFADGKFILDKMPDAVARTSALNSYALSSDLFADGKFILDKMPDAVARTSALNSYALKDDLLKDGKFILDKIPNISSDKITDIGDFAKVQSLQGLVEPIVQYEIRTDATIQTSIQQGIQTALDDNERMSTIVEDVVSGKYLSINEYTENGNISVNKIPQAIARKNELFDSGTNLLNVNIMPESVLKDGDLAGYVQTQQILSDGKLLDNVMPSDVLKDGDLDGYARTKDLESYVLSEDIFDKNNKIDTSKLSDLSAEQIPTITSAKISDINQYQTKDEMSSYLQRDAIMKTGTDELKENLIPSSVARVTEVSEIVSGALEEVNASAVFDDTDNKFNNQTDLSLQKLKAIFSNIQIPEIAIQSIKTNNSTYGYCVLTQKYSSAIMNDETAYAYSDIKRKINIVDNALKTNQEGKNIYLLPHFSVLSTLVSYTLYNVTEKVFNLTKTKFYTYDSTNNQFVRCTSESQYSSSTKYYTSNEEDFLGIFDCYWVDRTIDFVDTEENANSRVKKLPFLKTLKTTDVAKDEQAYTSAMFTTQYGAVSTNNKVLTTNNVTLYYVLVYDNGERVLSGLNDNHLKMYTNSFGIEVVTELHNGNTMKPLLTGDISGDGIGDLNEEICDIKNKATNEIIETLDVTGNTEYYYEVNSDYNANTYGTTAKNWIEHTISWYNTNVWKNGASQNYIYLFCYKDGPAKLSSGTDCYGYYFRAVVYLNGTVSPLDWRPCIPYSLEAKQFNYPTIVDLSGNTTQVGFLPNSEVITFTSTMSTDDRVNKFLYRTAYKDVTETTTHTTPGSPEKRTISLTNGKTIEVNRLLGTYNDDVICSNEGRFKEANVALIDNLTAAVFYQIITHYNKDGYTKVYGLITLSMAAAILYTIKEKINDFITSYEISELLSNVYKDEIRTEYEADEFELYTKNQKTQDIINTGLDDIIHNNSYIVEAIAYAILNNIEKRGEKYKNFASFFVIDVKENYTQPQLLVLYNFWNIILKCVKANSSLYENFIELLQTDVLNSEGATLISSYLTNKYAISDKLPEKVGLIKDCSYSPEVPETVTQVTIHKQIENGKEARTIINGGFSNFKYSYNNGGTTEQSWTREWFQNNAIVRFLVKKTNVQKVYEYRKWNKYTKTWTDLGIEQYVDTTGNSGTTPHNPLPTPNSAAERISIRDNYMANEAIATLQNSLVGDMSATNDNVGVLVNRINELTAIINSMTGATSENRLKALTTSDNKRVTVSTESGPTVQGLSSAYQDSQDISGASSASPDVTLPDMNTSSVNIEGDLIYGKNYQMFPGLEV